MGRSQVGGLSVSDIENGEFKIATLNKAVTLGADLIAGIGGVAPNNYLFPVTFNQARVPNTNRIQGATPQITTRVMRRRTVGVGI